DLDLRRAEVLHAQRLADDRMADLVDAQDGFDVGVLEVNARRKGARDGHVHVAIDRRGGEESPEPLVVGRQIGAAAAASDAKGTAGDDHREEGTAGPEKTPLSAAHW